MLRLFKTITYSKEESTAVEILLEMKNIYIKSTDFLQHREFHHIHIPNWDTDKIANESKLAELLGKAIALHINFNHYQELPVDGKTVVKYLIANSLLLESANHESTFKYIDYNDGWTGGSLLSTYTKSKNGLSFSCDMNFFDEFEVTAINFSDAVFSTSSLLKRCILSSLTPQYSGLLRHDIEILRAISLFPPQTFAAKDASAPPESLISNHDI